jgi:hypothetical protein
MNEGIKWFLLETKVAIFVIKPAKARQANHTDAMWSYKQVEFTCFRGKFTLHLFFNGMNENELYLAVKPLNLLK